MSAAAVFELADKLRELKERKERLETELKDVNAQIEETDRALAAEMVANEIQNFVRGGRMFYLKTETYVSSVAERKSELIEWLKDNGYGSIVQETVHPRTLSATVKELMEENGDELPRDLAELVNVFEKTTVGLRKAK